MVPSDFTNEDGTSSHINDGSTAQYKEVGKGATLHYEFRGFDKMQAPNFFNPLATAKNTVNLKTLIQEQQILNESNPDLQPVAKTTFCNYGFQNVLKSVISATINSSSLKKLSGQANDMFVQAFTNPGLAQVDLSQAKSTAQKNGGFSFGLFYNPTCSPNNVPGHGHAFTFSVGDNISKGNISNIGTHNVFENVESFPAKMKSGFMFYQLAPQITPISDETKIPSPAGK